MQTKKYIALVVLLSCSLSQAQDTVLVDNLITRLPLNSHAIYFTSETDITPDSAFSIFQKSYKSKNTLNKINLGPVQGYYWVLIHVRNELSEPNHLFLQINQPHIYQLQLFTISTERIKASVETGIKHSFYQRPTPHRFFDFPVELQPNQTVSLLLKVYHLNSLSLPINLISKSELHQTNYRQNMGWGYWLGFLSFSALFALIAAAILRRQVFFWYFLYITSAALYGFTEQGYGFQFIFPDQAGLDAPAIIQLAVYAFVFQIKFSQNLLETRKNLPLAHTLLNAIFYFLLALLLINYVAPNLMFRLSPIVLPVVNIVTITGFVLLTFIGIKTLSINRIVAIFYLVAFLILMATAIFSTLNYGFGLYQYFGPNPLLLSYFAEAMILSIAMVVMFRKIYQERTNLLTKVNEQQKTMYQQYIDGIEKERSRIAGELHDDVGSRLSYLKRILQTHSEESAKTADQLDQLISDVRTLSHDLAPPLAHVSGLIPLLEKLITSQRQSTGLDIKLQVHNYTEQLTSQQIQQVYRIVQEAINNVIKHATASRVDIQVFGHPTEINLTIEDNGKGFNANENSGIGLNQMRIRAESLGGQIEINSRLNQGTQILIQIPIT